MSMAPFLQYDWSTSNVGWYELMTCLTHREVSLEGLWSAVCSVATYLTRVGDIEAMELI